MITLKILGLIHGTNKREYVTEILNACVAEEPIKYVFEQLMYFDI